MNAVKNLVFGACRNKISGQLKKVTKNYKSGGKNILK